MFDDIWCPFTMSPTGIESGTVLKFALNMGYNPDNPSLMAQFYGPVVDLVDAMLAKVNRGPILAQLIRC